MARETVFDKSSFVNRVRSEVSALESKVENYLAGIMEIEAKSKVDNNFTNTLEQFKNSVKIYSTTVTTTTVSKDFFPDEVYKILLARHVAEYKPPQIKKIDGTLVKEMAAYVADILGTDNETLTTADGKSYKVSTTLSAAGLSTVTYNGRSYIFDWSSNDTAIKAKDQLYKLLGELKTWGENLPTYLFNQLTKPSIETLFTNWSKALITCNLSDVRALYRSIRKFAKSQVSEEDVSSWTDKDYSNWLSKFTKKNFPDTNKQITNLQKKYKKLQDCSKDTVFLNDYKDGTDTAGLSSYITSLNSYKNLIAAYNDLQEAIGQEKSNFDSLIATQYIGYKISDVQSGNFNENNTTIICAEGNNLIEVSGSNVKVDTGSGDDTVKIGDYQKVNSNVKVTAGEGNDSVYNYGSNVTIDAGEGDDSIRSDALKVSIVGGNGKDNIEIWNKHVTVDAGAGNDSIYSHGSDCSILGGTGNDEILVSGGDYVDGGTGLDTIKIAGSFVTAYGGGAFDMLPTQDVFYIGSDASNVYINDFEFGDILNLPAGNYTARIEFGSTTIRDSNGKLIVCLSGFTEKLSNITYTNLTYTEENKQTTDGDDSINNDVSNIKIELGAGNDSIQNGGYWYEGSTWTKHSGVSNVTIDGGDGDDTIDNHECDRVSIAGGAGNDSIQNGNYGGIGGHGRNVTINSGEGNDYIWNYNCTSVTIDGGTGNDSIKNYGGDNISINGGAGNDKISNWGSSATIDGGAGDDSISLDRSLSVSIDAGAGNDSIYNYCGSSVTIDGGAGNDSISNRYGSSVTIDGGTGDDSIHNWEGKYVTIDGGDGDDSIKNSYGDSVSIDGGAGNDSIYNHGSSVTIDGGAGNDSIYNNGGSYVTINGGAGKDSIYDYCGGNTINGGASNDLISLSSYSYSYARNNLIQYKLGDGEDTVYGFNGDDTLSISGGSYSTKVSGNDVIVTIGDGSILLKDAASLSVIHIDGEEIANPVWKLSGSTATYGTDSKTLITVSGVKSLKGLSLSGKIVTVSAAALSNQSKIEISGDGYTLALADDVTKPSAVLGCVGKIKRTKKHKQNSDKISLKVEECLCQTYFIT